MEVSSINHLQQGEVKREWPTIQLVLQPPPLKDTKCFREGGLHECQLWKATPETHHLEANWVRRLERLLGLQQDTRLDEGGIMISHRQTSLEIAPFRIVQVEFYDLHQQDDGMDLFRATQYLEAKIHNLHIPAAAVICRLHKGWRANSRSNWHFSKITTPKMRSILETKLRHCGHISHEHRMSLPWSVVIC